MSFVINTGYGKLEVKTPAKFPIKIQKKIKSIIEKAMNQDDVEHPIRELKDYIKNLSPDAGTPQAAMTAYRKAKGWSQAKLSKEANIPEGHLSEMIKGKRSIGVKIAKKLGNAFGVDYHKFL